jgi:hypothetical protein
MAIRESTLLAHVRALRRAVSRAYEPPSPAVIALFNTLLEEALASSGISPLVREIPVQGPDASSEELLLWLDQLHAAVDSIDPWREHPPVRSAQA